MVSVVIAIDVARSARYSCCSEWQDIRARLAAELAHRQAEEVTAREQLAVYTAGGVVTPAQVLMVMVPGEEAAQSAEVKLETFNFTRYGTVPATVEWVTADAVVQQRAAMASRRQPAHKRYSRPGWCWPARRSRLTARPCGSRRG